MATTLTGKHRDLLSSKVTVLINSAYLKKQSGEAEQALAFLERAEIIANKSSEKLDLASVRVNKASILRLLGLDYRATAELQETASMLEPIVEGSKSRASEEDLRRSTWFKKTISLLLICNTELLKQINLITAEAQLLLSRSLDLAEKYLKPNHSLSLRLRNFEIMSRSQSSSSDSLIKSRSFASYSSSEEAKSITKATTLQPKSEDIKRVKVVEKKTKDKPRTEFFEKRRKSKLECIRDPNKLAFDPELLSRSFVKRESEPSSKRSFPEEHLNMTMMDPEVRSRSSTPSSRRRTVISKTTTVIKLPKLELEAASPVIQPSKATLKEPQENQALSPLVNITHKKKLGVSPPLEELKSPVRYQYFPEEPPHDLTFIVAPGMNFLNLKANMKCCQVVGSDRHSYLLTATLDVSRQNLYIQAEGLASASKTVAPECVQLSEFSSIINMLRIETVLPWTVLPRFINNFKLFMSYAVLPFIQLKENQGMMRIEIWEHSRNLLGPVKLSFLKENYLADVLHIEGKCLRILLSQEREDPNAQHSIDIHLDDFPAKMLLKEFEVPKRGNPEYVRPSFRPIESKNFKHLIGAVRLLEKYLEERGSSMAGAEASYSTQTLACRAYIVGPGFATHLWVLSDRRDITAWDICYYKGDTKLTFDYSYDLILFNYGIRIDRLYSEERRLLASCLLDSLTIAKRDNRPIIFAETIEEGLVFETKLSSKYKVRMSLIGYGQNILGVRVVPTNKDTAPYGVFLLMNGLDFSVAEAHPRLPLSEFISTYTSLPTLFSEGGWENIRKALQLGPDSSELYVLDGLGRSVYLETAQSVLKLNL
mmetsp:Transcript_20979/g.38850  ORF Transcript_20979/g.38850 Transcript_20979/m.38850 type:complete len:822 (+) Transcript_20979:828-3293(+)